MLGQPAQVGRIVLVIKLVESIEHKDQAVPRSKDEATIAQDLASPERDESARTVPLRPEAAAAGKKQVEPPETKEEQYKIKTMYSYPIFLGDKPFGVLNAQTVVSREFTDDEIYFVSVIANLILGAVKMRKRV